MSNIKGKVAIVTGGSRGIGKAIAQKLASEGCHVAFNYRKSKDAALALEDELKGKNVRCQASCIDVKNFEQVKKWIHETKEKFKRLDILINNAGITIDKALMMMSEDDWDEVVNTNLKGMFNAARSCIVTFMKQKSGDIINISSVSGVIGLAGQTNYSTTKGGMNAFTKALAKEVAPYGVRVNAVAPGYIETDILSGLAEQQQKNIMASIPVQRIGDVEDVANCVNFLLSKEAQYITGQIIQVDGGLAMR